MNSSTTASEDILIEVAAVDEPALDDDRRAGFRGEGSTRLRGDLFALDRAAEDLTKRPGPTSKWSTLVGLGQGRVVNHRPQHAVSRPTSAPEPEPEPDSASSLTGEEGKVPAAQEKSKASAFGDATLGRVPVRSEDTTSRVVLFERAPDSWSG